MSTADTDGTRRLDPDLDPDGSCGTAPSATAAAHPTVVHATNEYSSGVRGAFERCASLFVGLGITAGRMRARPKTLRYPFERLTLSPRWRGALRLTGLLGTDEVSTIQADCASYNARIGEMAAAGGLPPCTGNCPANVDARGQALYLAKGMSAEAYELVRLRNVLPGTMGRICHYPCESACKRNHYDEPIAIRPLHRVAYEGFQQVRAERVRPLPVTRGQRVAVIGSGPSGLAAAFDLMQQGYEVHCFEKEGKPGGALYSGVPAYRLPRDILHGEIDDLVAMGLRITSGVEVGVDMPIRHLIDEYDAVLIATGLQSSRMLPLPGADAEGVMGALEFLKVGNLTGDVGISGKRVLVVGGGNVAVDCARVALRVGASQVQMTSLESMDELPAHPWEIEEALDEGVVALCAWGPHSVMAEDGCVTGMRMQSVVSVFDAHGRFAPQFADEYMEVEADIVLFAIGQASDLHRLVEGSGLELTERGILPVDRTLMTTQADGVFACGEVVTGPGSAIGSIASGHEAAVSIHRYLQGIDLAEGRAFRPDLQCPRYGDVDLEGLQATRLRAKMPMAHPEERAKDFRSVELGITEAEGLREAQRCLQCESGVCVGCAFCARACPDYAIDVERVDDPDNRHVARYDLDLTKCCFCGLCAEQCPTGALRHTAQYELAFYHRDLMVFDKQEMQRPEEGSRATGADGCAGGGCD
ncbi:MAG: FAD-dependent oxidoreductase [Coriobacteriia bacterium]|nr:FAD-dependent oxidoreductase [Coriobacteriia bacterium]